MAVDAVLPVSLRAAAAAAAKPLDARPRPQPRPQHEDESARRASLPDASAASSTASSTASARRWRSFDAALLSSGRSAAADASAARGLAALARRIEQEGAALAQRRHGRAKEWLRSMGALFSSSRRERVALLQVQLVAETARANRSLAVLGDMRTLAMAVDAATSADDSRLLESLADADRALDEDCLHHALALQAAFLQALAALHASAASSTASATLRTLLEDAAAAVDVAPSDKPTPALAKFEKLLTKHKLLRPELKKALEQLCVDALQALATPSHKQSCIFDDRAPRDVMLSLVRELEDAIAIEAGELPSHLRPTLRTLVEQMVFGRLAAACYRGSSTDLDELNAAWRERVAKSSSLTLQDVGLPAELMKDADKQQEELFQDSIAAFSKLPHLVPSSVLAAFLDAVRTLYREAADALKVGDVSADVLLPVMVFVLSRADLPHLHSQVFLMEQFSVVPGSASARTRSVSSGSVGLGDEEQQGDGSEAAYYLACLQAAMGYLMGGCGVDGSVDNQL